MKIFRNIVLSRKTLLTHKLRTMLALVGITIGVAAVIIMVAVGKGAQQEVLTQIKEMGENLLVVRAGKLKKVIGRQRRTSDVTTLVMKDYHAISRECPAVALAAPEVEQGRRIKYGNLSTMGLVVGSTPDFQVIRNYPVANGRFFSESENRASKRVAVIGSQIREQLFSSEYAVGEIIRVGNIPFEIIGVLEPKGSTPDGTNEDDRVMIPINTAMRRVFNVDYIRNIFIRIREGRLMDQAETEIRALLRERHRLERKGKPDDFNILNQLKVIKAETETADSFTILISGTAAISLFVGGIGILGLMLLAVKERTNEIGLRMAAGARKRDILVQFLSESMILGFIGCIAGVVLGVIFGWGIGALTEWKTLIAPGTVFLAVLFSFPLGPVFGLYPARKASKLNPIEALRAE